MAHTSLKLCVMGRGLTGTKSYFATGEHEYTRWGFKQLIDSGVGLIQPDVMWMGGPTEFARVAALASAHGVAIVPHGCGVYGYFMAMAFTNIPLCEFMMMSETADEILPNFGDMFVEEPLPENGYISLPADRPGWGLTLNREKLNLVRPFPRDGSGGSGGEAPAASADK